MGRDVVQVQGHLPHAPDDVWQTLRDFCGVWHPWIATMREERGPGGARIRAFNVTGEDTLYREQETYVSDSGRVLGYTHLQGIRECEAYDARVTVTPAETGGCHVGWTARVKAAGQQAARPKALAAPEWCGLECGGWLWGVVGADGDHGSGDGHAQVSEREAFLLVVGLGTEARDLSREGLEEPDVENEEPRGAGVSDGGAISEAAGVCLWFVVWAYKRTLG